MPALSPRGGRVPASQLWALAALTAGLLALGVPTPSGVAVLWELNDFHGLTALDVLAAVPVLAGSAVVGPALWRARRAELLLRGVGAGLLVSLGAAGVVFGLRDTAGWLLPPSALLLGAALLRCLRLAAVARAPAHRSAVPSR